MKKTLMLRTFFLILCFIFFAKMGYAKSKDYAIVHIINTADLVDFAVYVDGRFIGKIYISYEGDAPVESKKFEKKYPNVVIKKVKHGYHTIATKCVQGGCGSFKKKFYLKKGQVLKLTQMLEPYR